MREVGWILGSEGYEMKEVYCTSVDTFTIVHALLDRVDGCARLTRLQPHSRCVPHEEVQTLSLDCLSAEPY